jgi:hypothetical protein
MNFAQRFSLRGARRQVQFEADQVAMRAWLALKAAQVVLSVGQKDRWGGPGFAAAKLRVPLAVARNEAFNKCAALNFASLLRCAR